MERGVHEPMARARSSKQLTAVDEIYQQHHLHYVLKMDEHIGQGLRQTMLFKLGKIIFLANAGSFTFITCYGNLMWRYTWWQGEGGRLIGRE